MDYTVVGPQGLWGAQQARQSSHNAHKSHIMNQGIWTVALSKKVNATTEYCIKWLCYDHSYDTWEPGATLHCAQLLKEFLQSRDTQYPY